MEEKKTEEKIGFNGVMPLEYYKLIKIDAVKKGVTIRNYIVEILIAHAEKLRLTN